MPIHTLSRSLLVIGLIYARSQPDQPGSPDQPADLVVYASTPAGILSAQAFRSVAPKNATIVLLDPGHFVGGMPASGLGNTDIGNHPDVIGGFARDFFLANSRVYDANSTGPLWLLEPHVAEDLFLSILASARVQVISDVGGVAGIERTSDGAIASVVCTSGLTISGRSFIDASYEGDLMSSAGVPATIGRESRLKYGETVAGRLSDNFTFVLPISPYDTSGKLLPLMSTSDFVEEGDGDDLLQAYNFRLCVTNSSSIRVPFPPPSAYNASNYDLFRRWIAASPPDLSSFFGFVFPIPWRNATPGECCKWDFNSDFAVSFDYVGASSAWPLGNASVRDALWEAHREYHLSLFYVLQHDPTTPVSVRDAALEFGLCSDEFLNNNFWPPQLYVREARRMVGGSVFTANDIKVGHVPDSVGLAGYALDAHHMQRVPCMPIGPSGMWAPPPFPQHAATCHLIQPSSPWPGPNVTVWVASEGHMGNNGAPNDGGLSNGVFEMPYSLLLPPRGTPNLLVPVAVSASHAAFNAIRLEPQWMMLGQAAGCAAALAASDNIAVQDVNVTELQAALEMQGARLHWPL